MVVEDVKQPEQTEAAYSHFTSPQKSDKPPFSLPWFSHPDTPFPTRTKLKRRKQAPSAASESVSLPTGQQPASEATQATPAESVVESVTENVQEEASVPTPKGTPKLEVLPPRSETPSTQEPSVDTPSTSPTSSVPSQQLQVSESITASPSQPAKPAARVPVPVPAVPAIPVVPVLPKPAAPKEKPATSEEKPATEVKPTGSAPAAEQAPETAAKNGTAPAPDASAPAAEAAAAPAPAPAPAKPKSWANLFTKPAAPVNTAAAAASAASAAQTTVNGNATADASGAAAGVVPGFVPKANSMAEAVQTYRVGTAEKIAFLEPRGLVNTGNMCYMNSVSPSDSVICLESHTNTICRFSKSWLTAFLSTTSWIKSARRLFTALTARLPFLMR